MEEKKSGIFLRLWVRYQDFWKEIRRMGELIDLYGKHVSRASC